MFPMARPRREPNPEHKDEAVKPVIAPGRVVPTVVRELGVNEATLGYLVQGPKRDRAD